MVSLSVLYFEYHKRGKDDNMRRITFTKALRDSFQARTVVNQMIDAGLTDEQIKAIWDDSARRAELAQSQV